MKRNWIWALTAVALTLGAAAILFFWQARVHREPLPTYGAVPSFTLTDQSGRAFDSHQLEGDVWVAGLIFTRCGGQCPVMLQSMQRLRTGRALEDGPRIVAITVDPEYDTPPVLSALATELGVESPAWVFLTGERDTVYHLARRGFLLGTEPTGGTDVEPILHSSRLVLVDRAGRVRGYYDGTDHDAVEDLRADARRLARSSRP